MYITAMAISRIHVLHAMVATALLSVNGQTKHVVGPFLLIDA